MHARATVRLPTESVGIVEITRHCSERGSWDAQMASITYQCSQLLHIHTSHSPCVCLEYGSTSVSLQCHVVVVKPSTVVAIALL